MPSKAISGCRATAALVWLLGALLVIAMLDKVPDLPATNPNNLKVTVSCALDHGTGIIPALAMAGANPDSFCRRIAAVETHPLFTHSNLIVCLEQAADPSPPILLS